MNVPVLRGVIDRRLLINFRVPLAVLQKFLPPPFRPKVVHGMGLAGICLIRLKDVRPRGMPRLLGFTSENAAHRIAVEWTDSCGKHEGVFIPRRDTSSVIASCAGGRLFPGVHRHSRFDVEETESRYALCVRDQHGEQLVAITAQRAANIPSDSVFGSLPEASQFFENGSKGWSPGREPGTFDCLELRSFGWRIEPALVEALESSFFDQQPFIGAAKFDSAFLMKNIDHEWHTQQPLRSHCHHTGTLSAFYQMP